MWQVWQQHLLDLFVLCLPFLPSQTARHPHLARSAPSCPLFHHAQWVCRCCSSPAIQETPLDEMWCQLAHSCLGWTYVPPHQSPSRPVPICSYKKWALMTYHHTGLPCLTNFISKTGPFRLGLPPVARAPRGHVHAYLATSAPSCVKFPSRRVALLDILDELGCQSAIDVVGELVSHFSKDHLQVSLETLWWPTFFCRIVYIVTLRRSRPISLVAVSLVLSTS